MAGNPLILGGARRRYGGFRDRGAAFDPASLFINGEAGVWYDPSDLTAEKVAWRRNLLTWTERFDNAAWSKAAGTTLTANTDVAPDGTTTADKFVTSTTSTQQMVFQAVPPIANGILALSVYAKAAGYNFFQIYLNNAGVLNNSSVNDYANFDLTLGTVTATAASTTASITSVGNGWYRCAISTGYPLGGATTPQVRFQVVSSGTAAAAALMTGDGTSGVLLWGAQAENGSTVTDYQRFTDFNSEFYAAFPAHTMCSVTNVNPVTTLGAAVGIIADKSQGFALGSELATNGNFATDTAWTKGTGVTIAAGEVTAVNVTNGTNIIVQFPAAMVTGFTYEITYTIKTITSGGVTAFINNGGGIGFTASAPGTYTNRIPYVAGSTSLGLRAVGVTNCVITFISARRVTCGLLWQNTSTSQPILDARNNRLLRSEEFDNVAWTKTTVTTTINRSSPLAPDGFATADTLTASGANATTLQSVTIPATATYTFSVWLRRRTGTGTVEIQAGDGTYSAVTLTTNFQRFSVTASLTNGTRTPGIRIVTSADAVDAWGAQLELGSSAGAYQRVATAGVYADIGLPRRLTFDGVDDSFLSPSNLNLTSTNKVSVFTGVQKLADPQYGCLVELSPDDNANNGSFDIFAPAFVPSGSYIWSSRGTVKISATVARSVFPAPTTNVVTGLGDIAAPLAVLRVDAVERDRKTDSQGTGNYSTYLFYVGRRNNATLPFNGTIFQLIVRGAATDDTTVQQVERWIAGKTGVTL